MASPDHHRAEPLASIERDSAVDIVKAVCLLIVVGLHAMMAGFTYGDGALTITNALEGNPIFAWTTWGLQIMPLFFLLVKRVFKQDKAGSGQDRDQVRTDDDTRDDNRDGGGYPSMGSVAARKGYLKFNSVPIGWGWAMLAEPL